VNVKFTNHGIKNIPAETIPRLVHAVEVIYSQCPGVDFHVNVVSQEMAPYTTDQDNVTEILNDRVRVLRPTSMKWIRTTTPFSIPEVIPFP
jgi:hypothetical protein